MSTTLQTNPKVWVEKALASIEGLLPADTNLDEYRDALSNLKIEGPGELTADEIDIINSVLSFQDGGKDHPDLQPGGSAHVLTPEPATELAQALVGASEPSTETVETENAPQRQLEATTGESDWLAPAQAPLGVNPSVSTNATSSNGTKQDEIEESPTPAEVEVPEGYFINSLGMLIPGASRRENLREKEDKFKEELKNTKSSLSRLRKRRSAIANGKKADPETKTKQLQEVDSEIAVQEATEKEIETKLREVRELLLSQPPETTPDESQPWYKRVYANCTGYAIKNSDETFKEVNKDVASTYLRNLGITQEKDTHTTSPLDRAILAIHDRHSVDMCIALAGHQPGIIDVGGGRKVLITRGPKRLEPVKGDFPTIRAFIDGMLRDQAIYFHCWMHLSVVPLYNGKLKRGQALILAGPKDSGKSVCQNLIITPLFGGRVARPYAHIVGQTPFNEEWFESEHLMLEDEAPVRDYDTQQLLAAGIKSLVANERQWCRRGRYRARVLP